MDINKNNNQLKIKNKMISSKNNIKSKQVKIPKNKIISKTPKISQKIKNKMISSKTSVFQNKNNKKKFQNRNNIIYSYKKKLNNIKYLSKNIGPSNNKEWIW